jgi:Holliday junction resolvase RusA-like endonuclease
MIGGRAHIYTPRTGVRAFKEACRIMFASVHQGPPLDGPVYVEIRAVFARPKRLVWKSKPMLPAWHVSRPDVDNVGKSALDSLNGIAWRDDSQVCWIVVRKVYASGDEQPHTKIAIGVVDELDAVAF